MSTWRVQEGYASGFMNLHTTLNTCAGPGTDRGCVVPDTEGQHLILFVTVIPHSDITSQNRITAPQYVSLEDLALSMLCAKHQLSLSEPLDSLLRLDHQCRSPLSSKSFYFSHLLALPWHWFVHGLLLILKFREQFGWLGSLWTLYANKPNRSPEDYTPRGKAGFAKPQESI